MNCELRQMEDDAFLLQFAVNQVESKIEKGVELHYLL